MRGYRWSGEWISTWVGDDELYQSAHEHPVLSAPKWRIEDVVEVRWSGGTCVGVITDITGITEAKTFFRPASAKITYDVKWIGHGHWVYEEYVIGLWKENTK